MPEKVLLTLFLGQVLISSAILPRGVGAASPTTHLLATLSPTGTSSQNGNGDNSCQKYNS